MKKETQLEYIEFLRTLVVEEIAKKFDFNCNLIFKERKWCGGSDLWVYTFVDDAFGLEWKYEVNRREFWEIASSSPKFRARIWED